jgi:hypothetical protein
MCIIIKLLVQYLLLLIARHWLIAHYRSFLHHLCSPTALSALIHHRNQYPVLSGFFLFPAKRTYK